MTERNKSPYKTRFRKDSLCHKILDHLHKSGPILRRQLYLSFSEFNYKFYARELSRMIREGYVEEYKFYSANHIRITDKGLDELKKITYDDEYIKQTTPNLSSTQKKRRKNLVNEVEAVLSSAKIKFGEDKISLIEMYKNPTEEMYLKFCEQLKTGVFYSSKELRQAYIQIIGRNEINNWVRIIGILFYKENYYFVYCVNKRLIQIRPNSENLAVETINNMLSQIDAINESINLYSKPMCLIVGRIKSMIPKLVYGRAWGKILVDEQFENRERVRAINAAKQINANNLSRIYSKVYYITADRQCGKEMRNILEEKEGKLNKWIDENPDITMIQYKKYIEGVAVNKERYLIFPYIDLLELYRVQDSNFKYNVICEKRMAEYISRIMGERLINCYTFDGEQINVNRYDNFGARIDGVKPFSERR